MQSSKSKALKGENNKRLNNTDTTNNQLTAARANVDQIMSETQVTIPSDFCTIEAKDWVDNGSRL